MRDKDAVIKAHEKSIAELEGALFFLLCFFEPDQHPYLDTNAMKSATDRAKYLLTPDYKKSVGRY